MRLEFRKVAVASLLFQTGRIPDPFMCNLMCTDRRWGSFFTLLPLPPIVINLIPNKALGRLIYIFLGFYAVHVYFISTKVESIVHFQNNTLYTV